MSLKDLRPALRAFLLEDATILGLVAARMYPVMMPQGVKLTSIVYNEITSVGDHHSEGASGLAQPRVQLAAWGDTADKAHALALAIKDRLDGYRGSMGSAAAEVIVQGAFFDSWRDVYDETAKMFGKPADYFVWYQER